jgi:dihydropyrimidinase
VTGKTQELLRQGKSGLAYHGAARPAVAEVEAVSRGLVFSEQTRSPVYFVHLSSPRSVELITAARDRGVEAIAETCPHYLVLDDSVYAGRDAARYMMTPPLRDRRSQSQLWTQLMYQQIHSVGSDHCGFSLAQREGIDDFSRVSPGIPGVETSLLLLYTFGVLQRHMTLRHLVWLLSANPAKIFGLWPRKGDIRPDADADLVLFDPRPTRTLAASELHSRAGFSPYEGLMVTGKVHTTICRGQVVYRDGAVVGERGFGRFLKCAPFASNAVPL